MPHHKSAEKRMRTSDRDRKKNIAVKSQVAWHHAETARRGQDRSGPRVAPQGPLRPRQRGAQGGCSQEHSQSDEVAPCEGRRSGSQERVDDLVSAQELFPPKPSGALTQETAQGLEASGGKGVPILHAMDDLDRFAHPSQENPVLPDDITESQRMNPDLVGLPRARPSLTAVHEAPAALLLPGFREAERRPARGVPLPAMVDLGDLDLPVGGQPSRGLAQRRGSRRGIPALKFGAQQTGTLRAAVASASRARSSSPVEPETRAQPIRAASDRRFAGAGARCEIDDPRDRARR